MSQRPSSSRTPKPEIEPIPGDVPKKFPNMPEPLDAGQPQHPQSDDDDAPMRSGAGEDPLVESGLPDNDPEQPKESDEEKSMQ